MKTLLNGLMTWVSAFLAAALVLAIYGFGSLSGHGPVSDTEMDLDGFARLPVVNGGRTKPMDTVARTALMVITGKATFREEDGQTRPAVRWLLDTMTLPLNRNGLKHRVFRIENEQLIKMLHLEYRPGSLRYSLEEVLSHGKELKEQADKAEAVAENDRDQYQVHVLRLAKHVELAIALAEGNEPRSIPLANDKAELANDKVEWLTLPQAADRLPKDAAVQQYDALLRAYAQNEPAKFNRAVEDLHATVATRIDGREADRASFETTFNGAEMVYTCTLIYLTVLLLTKSSWILMGLEVTALGRFLVRLGFTLNVDAFLLHTFALLARMYIQDRPPVTNLYSSAVFIGWGCVALGLAIELFMGMGLGNWLASVMGGLTLIIAYYLALEEGDTLEMMRAVLDTNFWLATHVVCVTSGYMATFVAAKLGAIYILQGLFTPTLTQPRARRLYEAMYAVVCFATLLSFVGTVLGGIWADYSWGRFWGWDPKENGAILIVIWNALVLHARWGGMVKERGMAVLMVVGSMITAWSWFGTNQLGVGLHAYGFNAALAFWLMTFWVAALVVIALGLVPTRYWWSYRAMAIRVG